MAHKSWGGNMRRGAWALASARDGSAHHRREQRYHGLRVGCARVIALVGESHRADARLDGRGVPCLTRSKSWNTGWKRG